ncbi:heme peroxidase, partial [Blyttiomyces helicus]
FNDQEIVALSAALALFRYHPGHSGFEGPRTVTPISFSNGYLKKLLEQGCIGRNWAGPNQFAEEVTGSLMMLDTDLALDQSFKKFVNLYATDEATFFS